MDPLGYVALPYSICAAAPIERESRPTEINGRTEDYITGSSFTIQGEEVEELYKADLYITKSGNCGL